MSEICFAKTKDVDDIMEYIGGNWKKDHLLSRDRNFFLYEFQYHDRINFVIHRNDKNAIDGILGFICSSKLPSDIWTVIWIVSKICTVPTLGIRLLLFLKEYDDFRVLSSPGINPRTIRIYNFLNMYTSRLDHYVMMNITMPKYDIAKIDNKIKLKPSNFISSNGYELIPLKENTFQFDFDNFKQNIPYKDEEYFIKRYFKHPIYKYDVFGISKDHNIQSLFVTRGVNARGKKALRIVDYLGFEGDLKYIAAFLYKKMIENNYEYIDFVSWGFESAALLDAGFFKIDLDSDDLIIPNYFEPFVQKNISINFFIDTKDLGQVRICKADGDQDRPSEPKEEVINE